MKVPRPLEQGGSHRAQEADWKLFDPSTLRALWLAIVKFHPPEVPLFDASPLNMPETAKN